VNKEEGIRQIVGAASSREFSLIIAQLIAAGSRSHKNIPNAFFFSRMCPIIKTKLCQTYPNITI
jgi:hypothetical protein